jgi:hypothetical protein
VQGNLKPNKIDLFGKEYWSATIICIMTDDDIHKMSNANFIVIDVPSNHENVEFEINSKNSLALGKQLLKATTHDE